MYAMYAMNMREQLVEAISQPIVEAMAVEAVQGLIPLGLIALIFVAGGSFIYWCLSANPMIAPVNVAEKAPDAQRDDAQL